MPKATSPPGGAAASPIRQAKADALHSWLDMTGGKGIDDYSDGTWREMRSAYLDQDAYNRLSKDGLSRADVDRAVDDLVNADRIEIDGSGGAIELTTYHGPVKGPETQPQP